MAKLKRENFEVSPEQEAEIDTLQELIEAPTRKDAILTAIHLALHLASETKQGNQVFVGQPGRNDLRRLLMLGIEKPELNQWTYLVHQAHPWKKQLHVKGRKLPAAAVWSSMQMNEMTVQEAADDWDLPVAAISEIVTYCESNSDLLKMESEEELRLLKEKELRLTLRLLVDECMLRKLLVTKLREAGHDVQTVTEAHLIRTKEKVIFEHAVAENRIVISNNCADFIALANARLEANEHHPGVLLVFLYNDRDKDMSVVDIVRAIANLEATGLSLMDRWISLGDYKY